MAVNEMAVFKSGYLVGKFEDIDAYKIIMGSSDDITLDAPGGSVIISQRQKPKINVECGEKPKHEQRPHHAELMARRASAGYGRNLQRSDIEELLKRLEKSPNPSFTPSGAPIMAELTTEELRAKLTKI